MLIESFTDTFSTPFYSKDYVFKAALTSQELEGFWSLRRKVFCEEQKIFQESDRDRYDDYSFPIICSSLIMGMEDQIVGATRIDEREPGLSASLYCVSASSKRS